MSVVDTIVVVFWHVEYAISSTINFVLFIMYCSLLIC
jgi:hypothetical protein